ncbi:hypothetical protein GL2_22880 [Microbulbifer sp. GL-2]|nr:hypothetical protein GL2_22880 [Microbulbifer sp. GL-2]
MGLTISTTQMDIGYPQCAVAIAHSNIPDFDQLLAAMSYFADIREINCSSRSATQPGKNKGLQAAITQTLIYVLIAWAITLQRFDDSQEDFY